MLLEPMLTIWAVGNAAHLAVIESGIRRPPRDDELEITPWELVERGRQVSAVELMQASDLIHAASRDIAPFFDKYDAWLTPTLAQLPIGLLFMGRHGEEATLIRLAGQLERAYAWAGRYPLPEPKGTKPALS